MHLSREDIQALYRRYGAIVYYRCLSFLKDEQEAKDALQEVFVRLMTHQSQLRGEASPLTWMYQVSTHYCLNRLRDAQGRQKRLQAPELLEVPGIGPARALDPEKRDLVNALLKQADEVTRELIIYYFMDEMTLEEIAEVSGLSVPTIRKRLRHFQETGRKSSLAEMVPLVGLLFGLLGSALL